MTIFGLSHTIVFCLTSLLQQNLIFILGKINSLLDGSLLVCPPCFIVTAIACIGSNMQHCASVLSPLLLSESKNLESGMENIVSGIQNLGSGIQNQGGVRSRIWGLDPYSSE